MINEQEIYVIIAMIMIVYLLYITKRSTYCFKGGWDDVGCCTEEGKQKQIRMLSGDCDESEAEERTIDCCYQTEWVGTCDSDGKKRQTREAAGNCDDLSTEREFDCCYQTEWANSGSCSSEGKQLQTREAAGNCDDLATEREIDCCYQTPWEGTQYINNTITQTREAYGTCLGEDTYTTRTATCDHNFSSDGRCGSGYGCCRSGCCSRWGWCGGGNAYCINSQFKYNAPKDWVYS